MYITLKSIKKNISFFKLETEDLVLGFIIGLLFTIFFLLHFYTLSFLILSGGIISLLPVDFSKCNRVYKLGILFFEFLIRPKIYVFRKGENK